MQIIVLTQQQITLVSDKDFDYLNQWKWFAHYYPTIKGFYAQRSTNPGTIHMHKEIAKRVGIIGIVDHKNLNGLDNQRENIRAATRSQNNANRKIPVNNTSGYRGVRWNKRDLIWEAFISYQKILRNIGSFNSAEEAAEAYNVAAIMLHGEFAQLNVIRERLIVKIDPNAFALKLFEVH